MVVLVIVIEPGNESELLYGTICTAVLTRESIVFGFLCSYFFTIILLLVQLQAFTKNDDTKNLLLYLLTFYIFLAQNMRTIYFR